MHTLVRTLIAVACFHIAAVLPAEGQTTHPGSPIAFHPPGMWAWDNWFVHDGLRWHAFYLQLPKAVGRERRWTNNDFYKHIGHAVSTNLRDWQDRGPALCALAGTWNDRHIATGSVVRHADRWWMAFTGRGTKGDGVGLAVSDDLLSWRAEAMPLFALTATSGDAAAGGTFSAAWQGVLRRWVGISDPYIVPQPQNAEYLMVLCARVVDVPLPEGGCVALVRSRDLHSWHEPTIVAWPRCFERMETPQLWQRGDRWYLSFGGVLDAAWAKANQTALPPAVRGRASHQNYCYVLPRATGPGDEQHLQHIAAPPGHYIMKVLPAGPNADVAIFTAADKNDSGISAAYPVRYTDQGLMRLPPE